MKILIDLTALADNFSGIERYAASLSIEIIKDITNDYILIFKKEIHPMFLKSHKKPGIQMIVMPKRNKLIFNQIYLPVEIYKHKADWYLFLAFPVPLLLFKKNMVSAIHDLCCWDCPATMNGLSKWYFRILYKTAILKCKNIITVSNFSKDRIVEILKYPKEKIWLIYCGVDEKKFIKKLNVIEEKYNLPDQYILSLSTLEPRKNLRLLIEAYRSLILNKAINLNLVLAGRKGWNIDELLTGIEDSIKEKISLTGFIDDEDLSYVYGSADLFVFPSMYEGFGIPPLEAMACGTVVVSSDASSLPEVLGDAAIYFENQNKQSLEEKIQVGSKLTELEKLQYLKSSKLQCQKFNWSKEAEKLLFFINFKK